jgi:hypothetical protein
MVAKVRHDGVGLVVGGALSLPGEHTRARDRSSRCGATLRSETSKLSLLTT